MAQKNLVGQTVLGYTVTEKINSGAFGTVYKVEKVNPSGEYVRALKHITIPTDKQYMSVLNSMGGDISKVDNYFSEKLKDIVLEIQILNNLSEKGAEHIVRYYENDIIMTDAPKRYDVYILMEYLTPLEDYIRDNSFSVRNVLALAFDVLEGLKECHENGVWHRDIKDENIFVSNNGNFKIGDFGVSKILKGSSKAESLKGTPNFLAPEVYLGKWGYTENVDLYSLGIVLYRLLNYGRNPFLPKFPEQYFSQDEDVAFEKRMTGAIPDLPLLGGGKVGAVIIKAIANSEERYQTADAFLEDLENAVKDTDREILIQSVKMEFPQQPSVRDNESQKIYRETIGELLENSSLDYQKEKNNLDFSANKHLFDSIGEVPIENPVSSDSYGNSLNIDIKNSGEKKGQQYISRKESPITKHVPIMDKSDSPEIIDHKIWRKAVFVIPFIFLFIALIICFIIVQNSKVNYLISMYMLGSICLIGFIVSLIFVGKQFQKKSEPNTGEAILIKKEAYFLAQDITEALKLEYQKNKNKEINTLLIKAKRIEEKLSVESDFGYGENTVINCENDIARQLRYMLDLVPYISTDDRSKNISELNKTILNINSLLKKRMELKKK